MLEPNFQIYTPGVRRLYSFEYHRDEHLLSAEVRRTLEQLAIAATGRIAKGQSTNAEASAERALWLSIAEELEANERWLAEGAGHAGWSLAEKLREMRAVSGAAWEPKVTALRREIEVRRAGYGEAVDKGLLTRDQARTQLERLEAVHDLYWRHLYAFDGTREQMRELGSGIQSASIEQFGQAPAIGTWSSDDPPTVEEEGKKAA